MLGHGLGPGRRACGDDACDLEGGWRRLGNVCGEVATHLEKMLGEDARHPRTVFTDRGTGMYIPLGKIVHKYEEAFQHAGFKPYWGDNAGRQSPDMGDLLLHETAVAWFRKRMVALKPEVLPWLETREMWCRRAHQAASYATNEYDVAGLCREFPARLQQCLDEDGERLRK